MTHRKPKRLAPRLVAALAVAVIASGTAASPMAYAAKTSGGSTCKRSCTTSSPTVAFTSPSAGAALSGTVTATGSASDSNGISSVQVSVDGGAWSAASGTTSWSATINTTSYTNGAHTLEAKATNSLGYSSTTMLSVSISNGDTAPPTVSISSPGSGATVGGAVTVSGQAGDNVSVASVAVQIDGGSWQPATGTSTWTWSWDTTAYANGSHTLTARSTDAAGNTTTQTLSVTVSNVVPDTTPPTVTIASPTPGSTVSGTVAVSGSASDNSTVAAVDVQVNGGSWVAASGTTSWSWAWNTAAQANGNNTIAVRATDTAGNVSTTTVTVNVNNATTSAPNSQGTWTSPEGATIIVNTAGSWTISQVYSMLKANALDLATIGPHYTLDVQDQYTSQTMTSAVSSGGSYSSISMVTYLQGVNSNFASRPDDTLAHEYGHAWSTYYYYAVHNASWMSFEQARWTASDGSTTLATDSRTNSSYSWQVTEILADDYRLLFGSSLAVSERNGSLNQQIPDPRNVPGLSNFLYTQWRSA